MAESLDHGRSKGVGTERHRQGQKLNSKDNEAET